MRRTGWSHSVALRSSAVSDGDTSSCWPTVSTPYCVGVSGTWTADASFVPLCRCGPGGSWSQVLADGGVHRAELPQLHRSLVGTQHGAHDGLCPMVLSWELWALGPWQRVSAPTNPPSCNMLFLLARAQKRVEGMNHRSDAAGEKQRRLFSEKEATDGPLNALCISCYPVSERTEARGHSGGTEKSPS